MDAAPTTPIFEVDIDDDQVAFFDTARPYDAEGDDLFAQALFPELAMPALRDTQFVRNGKRIACELLGRPPDDVGHWGHAGGASFHHPRTLHHSRPNTTDRARRAYANEYQTRPVKRDVPADRPWIGEGRDAFEARNVFQP